jgi:glutamate racemase
MTPDHTGQDSDLAMRRNAPIGVFDSGVGGLTVLRAIRGKLPAESTVYLGDTARVPYGPKSPDTVRRYTLEAVDFLLGHGVKAIVIACNTATARAHSLITDRLSIPVIGVVEPGSRAAAAASESGVIGVIGTQGTIESATYDEAIRAVRPDAVVHSTACPLLVALAEEGWTKGEVARLTAEHYLQPLLAREVDTLVLGCTHYPLLKDLLARVVGDGVRLIDSAEATAHTLAERLVDGGLLAERQPPGAAEYFVTDDVDRFRALADRFLAEPVERCRHVELPSGSG